MEFTEEQCLEEVKSFSWLMLGTSLKKDEVAGLIKGYINTHKYFLNEAIPFKVSFEQAVFSYYENVYQPITTAINNTGLYLLFEKEGTPLIRAIQEVSDSHYYLNSGKGNRYYSYEEVCIGLLNGTKGHLLVKLSAWLFRK